MSKTSFKTFCVEFYAKHVGKTGPEVYADFERSGLLRELDEDYEDLHGLGMEALMPLFDEWLGKEAAQQPVGVLHRAGHRDSPVRSRPGGVAVNDHALIRATIIPEVVRLISERFAIPESEALDRFYKSATAENLADEENGLYGQSALFIFGQYLEEVAERGRSAHPPVPEVRAP